MHALGFSTFGIRVRSRVERSTGEFNVYPRGHLDLDASSLASMLTSLAAARSTDDERSKLLAAWGDDAIVSSTVRCAFDALLRAMAIPRGREVAVTAVNIPDMFDILRHHGLQPVAVRLDPGTMAPREGAITEAITDRTALALVAHLFGGRVELDPLLDAAEARGIPVVEDCAQAFAGPTWNGHPRALASLFSFGPLKTATALGGCLGVIRDSELRRAVIALQQSYPISPRLEYLRTIAKYGRLGALSHPLAYGAFVRACRTVGTSHDELINRSVLGLKGDEYWTALRVQPPAALMAALRRRLDTFDPARLQRRAARGESLARRLPAGIEVLGARALHRTWSLFPATLEDPDGLVSRLLQRGYDATRGSSRLIECDTPPLPRQSPMRRCVYLPAYPELPEAAFEGLVAQLDSFAAGDTG